MLLDRSEAGTGELRQALGRTPPRLLPLFGRGLWALSESGLEEEQRFRVSLLCRWEGVGVPWAPAHLHPPGLSPVLTKERGVEASGLSLCLQTSLHLASSSASGEGDPQPSWRKIGPWDVGRTAGDSPSLVGGWGRRRLGSPWGESGHRQIKECDQACPGGELWPRPQPLTQKGSRSPLDGTQAVCL